uniref:Uncharacterized protein n=1 Tax=viral metagenome TaxID=1070528 RepID=A0A6M3LCZ5_9ZZZZ
MALDKETEIRSALVYDQIASKLSAEHAAKIEANWAKIFGVFEGKLKVPGVVQWDEYVADLVAKGFIDQDTAETLKDFNKDPGPIRWILLIAVKLLIATKNLTTHLDVYETDRLYNLMARATPNPAPPDALIGSMKVDPARSGENRAQMKRLGYNDTQIDNMILATYRLVEEQSIRTLWLRGHYDDAKMYERMRELGYTDTRTAEIIKTWQLYPGPQDLFTMVAKEAFEPDIYKILGLDLEFPSEQLPWLEAQGISREWAEKYWIAHWDQPSIGQGFEMLHRGIITRDELDLLFRAVEIPKFWREKLTAMTFVPFTRVDVRRMHELGVLTTEELVQAYQDIGYDGEKAVKLAEFTIRYNAQGDNSLTRSAVLTSYREDLISRGDALDLLEVQNLSRDAADFYLTMEDYKIATENIRLHTDTLKDRFLLGVDGEATTRSSLNKLGLRGSKIDALVDNWKVDQYKYEALPSKAELSELLITRVISEGQWREIMSRHGYSYQVQSWYLKLLERQITISAALPSRTDLVSWYKKKLIDEPTFNEEMRALGFSDRYIKLYKSS